MRHDVNGPQNEKVIGLEDGEDDVDGFLVLFRVCRFFDRRATDPLHIAGVIEADELGGHAASLVGGFEDLHGVRDFPQARVFVLLGQCR